MTLILGLDAVNDDKFTPWATSQKVLGLVFNTIAGTVSIPADKIVKARALVTDAYNTRALSRNQYRSLLGSFRHVTTCIRPAKAFLQRLRAAESKLYRWTSVPMTPHMREDLAWWRIILNSPTLNGVPLEYFRHSPPSDFTIEMDASDTGLCALDRAHCRVLSYRFSETELDLIRVFNADACNEFDINYRELLSSASQWRRKSNTYPISGFQQGYGSGRPVRSATIANNLMGVRHFFQASRQHFPVDHPQVRMLLKGISRLDSPPERKAPVSIQLLEACFASLNLASFSDQALWGFCDVAVFDRADNATLDASAATTVHIRLRGSKTNQAGQATTRMLRRSGHRFLYPARGALLLLRSRRSLPAELPAAMYMSRSGEPSSISARQVANTVQDAARRIGCDPHEYSTHSLRSGGATHMYHAGVDALIIRFYGRWASDTFNIYTRLCRESVSRLAASMVSGVKSATTLQ
ncbi:hypothetical protein PHYSODRAFT_332284 [Phytophthora sojae]|uniref:Tyr recombinase domain-containing protein n=1 Tax=Phytophthora sojae (strain P6497) TaxID=1094619 RepID=G4ZFN5_PHYSP|nr:hypothetical protein PHYSODRAFT_332284 [Phytophthora sojae]EGZ18503.1 hypothetical protein PHYSODRAFT_332284 [Phytophthora sojae]|eukprot:XP_009527561.1 hypothetical protein PHYSODRAFT_332284 [Phytophthora sojae]